MIKRMHRYVWLAVVSLFLSRLYGQGTELRFLVSPYLQDAEPNSMRIMWETSFGDESIVEWGETSSLENRTNGSSTDINFDRSRIHEVHLVGLERFTTYFYRVRTGALVSDIFQFRTPPFASDRKSFRLVAMSDMQRDERNPNKFREIVRDGVIPYVRENGGGRLSNDLALVMVPGDLVVEGPIYLQWQDHFFAPAQPLLSQVPVYPVPGNHERNADFFFKYFALPANGTPAYAEHWWYKDYGNVRIVGMDSNKGYGEIPQQITWLEGLMEQTTKDTAIDFVFAQMHHPHKSELWLAGESDFTGKVVKILERFTADSGKPSIHFFGHTHGYSRGQSRDHKHLWVNVATAGGRIDQWGEYAQENYDEFTVTQAEYGFVIAEVDPNGGDPKFTLKRISRGNEGSPKENLPTDSITVYRSAKNPLEPKIERPLEGELSYRNVILQAGPFHGVAPHAYHAASHWQVSEVDDFSRTNKDSWKQHDDWYFDKNLQAGDDLRDEHFIDLRPDKKYFWRVRYRDQFLNWSTWSEVGSFSTAE
ncbi:MAG: metallophosphoesterase family protein [Saprospiraceae bacterium]|nr:metallophosphoesterase family protein [Saprospiraceae bacterium]